MKQYDLIYILGVTAFCLFVVFFAWRLLSRRQSIPCPTWLGWLVEVDNPFSTINRAATIVENSGIHQNMVVLDAGCGPGRVTLPVARKVGPLGEVVAMDMQMGMLNRTQKKAESEKLTNISYLHAGLGEKKLECNKYDRVLLVTVLGEIPNREDALKEIFAALKPDGILSITEIIFDPHFQRRSTALRIAESVGFREAKRFGNCISYTLNLEKSR